MSSTPADPQTSIGIGSRNPTYLLAQDDRIGAFSAGPLDFPWLVEQMEADPEVHIQQRLVPRSFVLQSTGPSMVSEVVVATMPPQTAAALEKHPQVVLEEDLLVHPLLGTGPVPVPDAGPGLVYSPFGASREWQVDLRGPSGEPVVDATVYLYGSGLPAQGRTNQQGRVVLSLLNESDDTLRALYVNPLSDLWSVWVDRPALISGVVNTITVPSLAQSFPDFPRTQLTGWGQVAMGLHDVPADLDGRGIRVAVIDSGAAALTHPDLAAIRHGLDTTAQVPTADGWTTDTIAHGSHCSGIIAGSTAGGGIRGFAPAAEVHELRIFPGGRESNLLDALDYCINEQMDVVNMSLGTGGTSQIVLQKVAQARQQGVACIVAAGNSGGPVQFPGSSPDVLTVAAIGKDGEFPDSSYHAQQRWTGGTTDRGYFAAQFSCHGPQIDVCGPGVAIVSSVPDRGFAAWDGTSMATPHVAGLAALVLAHHPDFRAPALRERTAARVDRLFAILMESATRFDFGDPTRVGAGLPDAVRALGLDGHAPPSDDAAVHVATVARMLEGLRSTLAEAGLLPFSPQTLRPETATTHGVSPGLDVDQRRDLALLKAQLAASGLPVPSGGES